MGERLTLGLDGCLSRDDYQDTIFGLEESRVASVNAEAAWSASETVRLAVYYGTDRFATEQTGRSFTTVVPGQADDAARDWSYEIRDRFDSAGLNIGIEQVQRWLGTARQRTLPGELHLTFEYRHARSRSEIDVEAGAALVPARRIPEKS